MRPIVWGIWRGATRSMVWILGQILDITEGIGRADGPGETADWGRYAPWDREAVHAGQGGRCMYCGDDLPLNHRVAVLSYLAPLGRGGSPIRTIG